MEIGTAPQTSHWTGQDRTGQEPDLQSAAALARLMAELAVVDVWRVKHPHAKQ